VQDDHLPAYGMWFWNKLDRALLPKDLALLLGSTIVDRSRSLPRPRGTDGDSSSSSKPG
jgi:hypothetical protein